MGFNSVDRAKYALPPAQRFSNDWVERADNEVDIREILAQLGSPAPEGAYHSTKIFCPWNYEHTNPLDKNCRVYPPTHMYCFDSHGLLTPSAMYARSEGLSRPQAAKLLLEQRGLIRSVGYKDRWKELTAEAPENVGNLSYVVQALQQRLRSHPDYDRLEFSPKIRQCWKRWTDALDKISDEKTVTKEILELWLDRAEQSIVRVLEKEN